MITIRQAGVTDLYIILISLLVYITQYALNDIPRETNMYSDFFCLSYSECAFSPKACFVVKYITSEFIKIIINRLSQSFLIHWFLI